MLRPIRSFLLHTVDKLEIPAQLSSKQSSFYDSFPQYPSLTYRLQQLISFTMRYLELIMKAFRNMCRTKPDSYLTHLEEAQSLVEKPNLAPGKRPTRTCTGSKLPWIISTAISTSLALFLFVTQPSLDCASPSPVGSFETGFSTDLGRWPEDKG